MSKANRERRVRNKLNKLKASGVALVERHGVQFLDHPAQPGITKHPYASPTEVEASGVMVKLMKQPRWVEVEKALGHRTPGTCEVPAHYTMISVESVGYPRARNASLDLTDEANRSFAVTLLTVMTWNGFALQVPHQILDIDLENIELLLAVDKAHQENLRAYSVHKQVLGDEELIPQAYPLESVPATVRPLVELINIAAAARARLDRAVASTSVTQ